MNWSFIGLVIDVIGALCLYIGSELLNGIVLKLIQHLQFAPKSQGLDDGLIYVNTMHRKMIAALLSRFGLLLIIIGFVLQAVGTFNR